MDTEAAAGTGKPEIPREIAFCGQRLPRKVASALLLGCALPLLVLAYALHMLSAPTLDPRWWLIGGMTLPALLVFTAILMTGAAAVMWDLSSAVSRLAGLVTTGQMNVAAVTDRSDEIGRLATSFAQMAATIERQAHEIDQLPGHLDQLRRQSFKDPLTSLPNRSLFLDRVAHGLARAVRKGQTLSVLFIDLDRFKLINDSLGHSAGDRLLVEASRRLQSCARAEDTVARLGGDEFGLLLEDVKDLTAATAVAERIAVALRDPFPLGGREIAITASIGIALSSGEVAGPEELLHQADLAMYRAKAEGPAHHEVFRGGMDSPALKRLDLEVDLRRAVERRELTLRYQPIVALDSGRVTGVEALIRWDHMPFGTVLPAEIIQVLEDIGLIIPVGQWILREACRQAAVWQADRTPAPTVSVNLSVRQLQASSLVDDVAAALRQAGLKSDRLKLEITESTAMADVSSIARRLRALRDMGIRLAIDDFGSGDSCLARLKHFPVEELKIDRSLIRGIPDDPMDVTIVDALARLARGLKMTLTAEGVETSRQALELKALGCTEAQGYYFAPPLPPDRVQTLLRVQRVSQRR